MEEQLQEFAQKLVHSAKDNLCSLVLYGSAVNGHYHKHHSDVNLLCILHHTHTSDIEALHEPVAWWKRKGYPAPLLFTLEELRCSADIFSIELMDMKASHRILYGEDFFHTLEVPMHLHKLQVERELRTNLARFRQGLLAVPPKNKVVVGLMDAAVSAFVTLFRHALIALGEPVPQTRKEVVERVAALAGGRPEAFVEILELHEGKCKPGDIHAQAALEEYAELIERVTNEMDRRLHRNP